MLGLDIYMTYYEIQDILKDLEESNKAVERANAKFKTKEELNEAKNTNRKAIKL